MLGMMNCPTDNVEFYSAPPSMRRAIEEHHSSNENMRKLSNSTMGSISSTDNMLKSRSVSESCEGGGEGCATSDSDSDVVRVFSEAREKPHITYTSDGRKLLDGKDMSTNMNTTQDPIHMWDRLILGKIATSKLDERMNAELSHTNDTKESQLHNDRCEKTTNDKARPVDTKIET